MRVHLTDTMFRGLILLAIKEGWDEEEVDKRVEQFAMATELNNGGTMDEKRVIEIAKEVRVSSRRKNMKVVGGTHSPAQ